jgi:hypothetical protein
MALRAVALAAIGWAAMRRRHHAARYAIWPVLIVAVTLGLTFALVLRPPPETAAPSTESLP